ncbi:hypothetical protein PB1_16514 [Bacillus methanolicus PB1]|uniref:Uncharacterized protein n=1 Tax=Bacillus methanolicus PB1 TaxID=997296 RepID=I3DY57_BACMT|nr:hypothetical protein [Bacillus methanolicus]EIJ79178.1 hypothetical protein PB1_16514 [Bacillus methanolicus PB1]
MIIDFFAKKEEKSRKQDQRDKTNNEIVRIPIIKKIYMKDREIYYEIEGENIPRKWEER